MTYGYDQLNRLSSVTDASGVTNYSYDPVGNLAGYTYPNGVATSYTYDNLNRLTSMQSTCGTGAPACGSSGTAISSYAYTLGAAGNRLSVAELSGRTVTYGYDDLYRLTSETVASDPHGNNGQVSYTFDKVGNRLQRTSTLPAIPATGLLNYDANDRTTSDPYDANGNLLNGGVGTNVYDFENRMVKAGGVKLVYDGDGNRVKETVAATTTSYLVADQNLTGYAQVLDELQGGAVSRTYSYGLTLISQRLTANGQGLSFYLFDGHGSVRFLTDSTGGVTDSYDYDAFGNLISQTGTTPNNYLFAGEQFDPALGIYYNRARYYDQRQGRFWTMDTFEGNTFDPPSLHKYFYASTNPVNRVDPSGNETLEGLQIGSAILLGIGALAVAGTLIIHDQISEGDILLSRATDARQVPIAIASAIQARRISPALQESLKRRFSDYVFFVHGTSESSAQDINLSGVDKDKILAGGRGSLIPGAFFTFLLEPNPVAAIQLALVSALRKPSPHAVMVGYLPRGVFNSLKATQPPAAVTRPLIGADYDETVFFEDAFPTLDLYNLGRWGIALVP